MNAVPKQSGWADDRMMQAYDLIWEVQQTHKPLGIEPEFRALLGQIEACDNVLVEAAKESAA